MAHFGRVAWHSPGAAPRSVRDAPVPIDVIDGEAFAGNGAAPSGKARLREDRATADDLVTISPRDRQIGIDPRSGCAELSLVPPDPASSDYAYNDQVGRMPR